MSNTKKVILALVTVAVLFVAFMVYTLRKGAKELGKAMSKIPDSKIVETCLEARKDPQKKAQMSQMVNSKPESLDMLKKVSPDMYKYSLRVRKLCAPYFTDAPAAAGVPQGTPVKK